MSSAAEIVKAALLAGTFSNHSWENGLEAIYILGYDKVGSKEARIELGDIDGGELIQSSDDTVIYQTQLCTLEIITRNITDRENIFEDVKDILKDNTSNGFTFTDFNRYNPTRNRKNIKITIEVVL